MSDVIIIGAGISGLSCAWTLKKLGIEAVVVETAGRAGGVIQSESVEGGFLVERGPNSFQLTPRALAVIDEIGLWEDLQAPHPQSPRYIYLDGRLRKVPLGALSLGGILRVFGEPFVRSKSPKHESVGQFFRRRFGPQVHDRLVAPMLTGIYAADADQLSMAAVFPRMVQMESEHGSLARAFLRSFTRRSPPHQPQAEYKEMSSSEPKRKPRGTIFSFLTGMQALTNRLAENVRVQYNVSDPRIGDARATVVATPAHSAARVVQPRNASLAALLDKIRYAPMVIAATSLAEDSFKQPLRGFGFLVPRHQQMHLLGTLFSSALFTGRAPMGRALLTSFVGGAFEPEAIDWPGDRVYEVVCSELQRALKTAALPDPVALFRHRYAIPQYSIGHEDWAESVRSELKQSPGLFLAGNYIEGISVTACMDQGERTAHAVAEYLRRST